MILLSILSPLIGYFMESEPLFNYIEKGKMVNNSFYALGTLS